MIEILVGSAIILLASFIISIYTIFAYVFIYKDAKLRQENAILWLILSIFFNPISFIIYYFIYKNKEYPQLHENNYKYFKRLKIYTIIMTTFVIMSNIIYFGMVFFYSLMGI